MGYIIFFTILTIIIGFVSYKYYETLISNILNQLILLDKIFEERYTALTKAISQFQNFMPDQKSLIFDIQRAKADVAKYAKPKNTEELALKILNENALTINLNYLIDKCDFSSIEPALKEHITTQAEYIHKISNSAKEYNNLISTYKKIIEIFPFNIYTKMSQIKLNLDKIKTE